MNCIYSLLEQLFIFLNDFPCAVKGPTSVTLPPPTSGKGHPLVATATALGAIRGIKVL